MVRHRRGSQQPPHRRALVRARRSADGSPSARISTTAGRRCTRSSSPPQRRWFAIGEDLNNILGNIQLNDINKQRRWFAIGEDLNVWAINTAAVQGPGAAPMVRHRRGSQQGLVQGGGPDGRHAAPMVRHRRGSQRRGRCLMAGRPWRSSADGSPSARFCRRRALRPRLSSADGSPSARISTPRCAPGWHRSAGSSADGSPSARISTAATRWVCRAGCGQRRWFAIGEDLNGFGAEGGAGGVVVAAPMVRHRRGSQPRR